MVLCKILAKRIMNKANYLTEQSFFKLPLLFISVVLIAKIGYYLDSHPSFFDQGLSHAIGFAVILPFFTSPVALLLYFLSAILACQTFHLHYFRQHYLVVCVIGIIFSVFLIFSADIYSFLRDNSLTYLKFDYNLYIQEKKYSLLFRLVGFIDILVSMVIIFLLFFITTLKNSNYRDSFDLYGHVGAQIYAHTYSVLILTVFSLIAYFTGFTALLTNSLYSIFVSHPYLIVAYLAAILISYLVAYFSSVNVFRYINLRLKIGKLIGLVMVVYLFSTVAFVCAFCIMIMVEKPLATYLLRLVGSPMIVDFIILSICFVFGQLIIFGFGRQLVKIMYR